MTTFIIIEHYKSTSSEIALPKMETCERENIKNSVRQAIPIKPWLAAIIFFALYGLILYWITAPTPALEIVKHDVQSKEPSLIWVILKYLLVILLTAVFVRPLIVGSAQEHWRFFKQIRPVMIIQNLLVLVVVGIAALATVYLMPFLDRSWLYNLHITRDGSAPNIYIIPFTIKFFGLFYAALFVLDLPVLAYDEEEIYRKDTRSWRHGMVRSLRFGLMHCFVGGPIYIGLALSIGGLWFTYQYFKGGIERCTTHHLTYNLIVVSILLIIMFSSGLKI